jgi:hypothetical protein
MMENNCKLGCTSHLSTWFISTWLIWDIPTCCSYMFSLISNKCLAILIFPSVPALLSLSRSSKPLLIKENVSSQKFFTSLSLPFLSDMFCSQTFNKILTLVCSMMDNFELLTISIFVVAITVSWKVTRATLTSLSLKEMFPNIYSIVQKWFSPLPTIFVEP